MFDATPDLRPLEVRLPPAARDRVGLLEWLRGEADALRDLAVRHGAVFLRDCPIQGPDDFEAACRAVTPDLLDYTGGGSLRRRILGKVYNSTEFSADQAILQHLEASYFPDIPSFVWFHCDVPAATGGETPVCDMAAVLRALDPSLVARFVRYGIRYQYNLHAGRGFGRGWPEAFETDDRGTVEAWLSERGMRWTWDADGTLRAEWSLPALRTHPVTGVEVWGNGAANWHPAQFGPQTRAAMRKIYGEESRFPINAQFGDGSTIPDEDILAVIGVLNGLEQAFPWGKGDVMLCDNRRMAHGRRPFTGQRRVLVVMA